MLQRFICCVLGLAAVAGTNRGFGALAQQAPRALAEAHDARGVTLGERGEVDAAAAAFREAIRSDPTFAVARFHLGLALERRRQLPEAAAAYMQALRLDRQLLEARYGLSAVCAAIGDVDGAIELLRQVVVALPSLAEAHYNLGLHRRRRYTSAAGPKASRDLDESVAALRRAVALAPQQANFHAALGQALADQQDVEAAVDSFRQALALEPQVPERAYDLGLALRLAGDFEGAETQLRSALAARPSHGPAHRALGLVLRTRGELANAAREFRAAAAASPDDAQAHHLLGAVLLKLEDASAGMEALKRAVSHDPSLVEAHVTLAQALAKAGRHDEAQREQDEIRRLNSERAAVGRAMVLLDTAAERRGSGDIVGSVAALREAVVEAPALAEAHYELARALIRQGAPKAEIDVALGRTLELAPRHAPALFERGLLESQHRQKAAALETLNHATTIAPGLVKAQRARAQLAAEAGDWPTAVAALDAVIAFEPLDGNAHAAVGRALLRQHKADEAAVSEGIAADLKGAR